jgi:hypothetical protein
MASTAGASPAYQGAGEWHSYPTHARVTALAASGDASPDLLRVWTNSASEAGSRAGGWGNWASTSRYHQ